MNTTSFYLLSTCFRFVIYPWQHFSWKKIAAQFFHTPRAVHHALLIHGAAGIGKTQFAQALAFALLCETRSFNDEACGRCCACHWLKEQHHPDFLMITPGNHGQGNIVLEQIHQLVQFSCTSSYRGNKKIIMLDDADMLNIYAAHALLKTLEEPCENVQFILVSAKLDHVLATIRSRCQLFPLPFPDVQLSQHWLHEQKVTSYYLRRFGNAPIAAYQASQCPEQEFYSEIFVELAKGEAIGSLQLAHALSKKSLVVILAFLQRWVHDLFLFYLSQQARYFPEHAKILCPLTARAHPWHLYQWANVLVQARRDADKRALNAQLLLEKIFIRYARIFRSTL